MSKVLIADDDRSFVAALASNLRRIGGFSVLEASTGGDVFKLVESDSDICCLLLDYSFEKWGGPGQMNGLEIADQLKTIAPTIQIIMMSEVAGIREVDEAHRVQNIAKFVDENDFDALLKELKPMLERIAPDAPETIDPCKFLVASGFHTTSHTMNDVCRDAFDAARSDLNVLITGETGTGKTELARAIHKISVTVKKREDRFQPVNCAAIPKDLFDSHLFGHKKGAFTGADEDREGLMETAGKGTLFLDELVEIPATVQAKLNHALEPGKGKFRRVGDTDERDVMARVIAATNENIREAIASGRLRQDVFYRFDQIIVIPPLRERREDIPGLADHCLSIHKRENGVENLSIEPEGKSLLQRQLWLGNVRQLYRVIKRAAFRAGSGVISVSHIQRELRIEYGIESFLSSDSSFSLDHARAQYIGEILNQPRGSGGEILGGIDEIEAKFRKDILIAVLKETKGNVAEAARHLGRTKLAFWLKELGIDPEEFRG